MDPLAETLDYLFNSSYFDHANILYVHRLYNHPQIHRSRKKEKHWYNKHRFTKKLQSVVNYSAMFKEFSQQVTQQPDKVVGDYTPSYMYANFYWKCYQVIRLLNYPSPLLLISAPYAKSYHYLYASRSVHTAFRELITSESQ